MSATRRLDILAVIGGILAVMAIVIPIAYGAHLADMFSASGTGYGRALLKSMPTPDMRADFMLPGDMQTGSANGPVRRSAISRFEMAAKKNPDSARLQLRLGQVAEEPKASEALGKAAQLDPGNALPLYALAYKASEKGRWDEATSLLTQANRRNRIDWYPFPLDVCNGNGLLEMQILSKNSLLSIPSYPIMRRLTVDLGHHASQMQSAGRTNDALAILGQLREMGWKLIRQDQANLMDMLVGMAIVRIAEKPEQQIYTATGDKAGLARIERDEKELARLRGGGRAYLDQSVNDLANRVARFSGFSTPIAATGAVASLLTILSLISWGVLAVRSRGQAASELHQAATKKAFTDRKLPSLYAMMLAVIIASTLVLVRVSYAGPTVIWLVQGTGALVSALSVVAVLAWANKAYRRRYQQVAESDGETVSTPWKGYPIADKRECQRRLTGVMGGVMISLAVWGVVLSARMKTSVDAYPWQMERATAGMYQEETKYVHDLVTGKIKVPEKYLKTEQKKDVDKKCAPSG